jgi:TaqI-like C-terminal specificity domain
MLNPQQTSIVPRLLEKLRKTGKPLGEYVNGRFYHGIKTGFNEAFVVDRAIRDRLIAEHSSSAEVLKPFLRGQDIKRWVIEDLGLFLCHISSELDIKKYPAIYSHLKTYEVQLKARPEVKRKVIPWYALSNDAASYWQEFELNKILYQEITIYPAFAWDDSGFYSNNKTFIIPDADLYLLALLNSKLVCFFLDHVVSKLRGAYAMRSSFVSQVPIAQTSEDNIKIFIKLVEYIIYLERQLKEKENDDISSIQLARDKMMARFFEQIIDGMVYELYLPEELHKEDKYFVKYICSENLPQLKSIKGDKMQALRQIFERMFDINHPIRKNVFFLDSLEAIRIIQGKA